MRIMRFTLIELLIVISIIAILASLLLPSLNKAKELGRGAECQSHLKQFGLAAAQYSNDYGEYTLTFSSTEKERSWYYAMGPYLKLGETKVEIDNTFTQKNTIYTCPSHRWRGYGTYENVRGFYGRCYSINYHFDSLCDTDYFNDGRLHPRIAMVQNPSWLIYLMENDVVNVSTSVSNKIYGDLVTYKMGDGGYYVEPGWHNGYPNQLRFDGHVDKSKWGTLQGHMVDEGVKIWNLTGNMGKR